QHFHSRRGRTPRRLRRSGEVSERSALARPYSFLRVLPRRQRSGHRRKPSDRMDRLHRAHHSDDANDDARGSPQAGSGGADHETADAGKAGTRMKRVVLALLAVGCASSGARLVDAYRAPGTVSFVFNKVAVIALNGGPEQRAMIEDEIVRGRPK